MLLGNLEETIKQMDIVHEKMASLRFYRSKIRQIEENKVSIWMPKQEKFISIKRLLSWDGYTKGLPIALSIYKFGLLRVMAMNMKK